MTVLKNDMKRRGGEGRAGYVGCEEPYFIKNDEIQNPTVEGPAEKHTPSSRRVMSSGMMYEKEKGGRHTAQPSGYVRRANQQLNATIVTGQGHYATWRLHNVEKRPRLAAGNRAFRLTR